MHRLRWFLLGAALPIVIAMIAGTLMLWNAHGFSAREQPTRVEAWFARIARSAAIPAGARSVANPVPNTSQTLADARAHWADHCAVCPRQRRLGRHDHGKATYPPLRTCGCRLRQRLSWTASCST